MQILQRMVHVLSTLKQRPGVGSVVVVLLLSVWLCGCDRQLRPVLDSDAQILAFGDSLTAGVGAQRSQSYPVVLAQLTGRQVISAGVSGEVTRAGLPRLESLIDTIQPAVVILLEGGNDILRNHDLADTKNNLRRMIEYSQQNGAEVVLIAVPAKNLLLQPPALYAELAAEYSVLFDDQILPQLLRQPRYKSDAIHLNAHGYSALAQAIHELLVRQGVL